MLIKDRTSWLSVLNQDIKKYERRFNKRNSDDNNIHRRNSFYTKRLAYRITKEEEIFANYLLENKIKFHFQKGFFKPFHRICDFYISKQKICIEIDGGYHNEIIEKDKHKDKVFQKRFSTIRFTNEEVLQKSDRVISFIKHLSSLS